MSKSRKKRSLTSWTYPFLLGIFMFNILRITTDFTKKETFWTGDMQQHIISLAVIILICYITDYLWRLKLEKRTQKGRKHTSVAGEYFEVFITTTLSINLVIFTGEKIGLFYLGDGIIDYMLANVVFIPLFLLYYTLLRNDIVDKQYMQQMLQFEELKSKQLETELDYLKAQYHPHFLFNALNTVYFQIDEEKEVAKRTVEVLSELLRYQLYGVEKLVTIGEEIEFINNYIQFQQLRISELLKLTITVDPELDDQLLHPLLFQPLLENAFKYAEGDFRIDIDIRMATAGIQFTVKNTVSEMSDLYPTKKKGIGIENLRRRLAILYPDKHILKTEKKENEFCAWLTIQPEEHGN